jgi:hypothetical protein
MRGPPPRARRVAPSCGLSVPDIGPRPERLAAWPRRVPLVGPIRQPVERVELQIQARERQLRWGRPLSASP